MLLLVKKIKIVVRYLKLNCWVIFSFSKNEVLVYILAPFISEQALVKVQSFKIVEVVVEKDVASCEEKNRRSSPETES